MRTVSSGAYVSSREWLQNAVGGEKVILRGVSALDFLRLFVGYLNETEIDVYAESPGQYENINYHIVESFDDIEFIRDGNILCSTFNQAINDLLSDAENADDEALANALSNYYHANNKSFDGLHIRAENAERFEEMKGWAIEYYNDV